MVETAINASVPSAEIIQKYGLAVWLVVVFCLGLFVFTGWIVRYLLKSHEKEREEHQRFFSDAIKSNTQALVQTATSLSDASSSINHSMEVLGRIEEMIRENRKESQKMNESQDITNKELYGLNKRLDGMHELQKTCQDICRNK